MRPGSPARVFVGIGGNVGDRLATLRSAVASIRHGAVRETALTRVSCVYETRPIGPSSDPFLNAALELQTTLAPSGLLDGLLGVERAHGRDRSDATHWGPRTLDLDILIWLTTSETGEASLPIDTPQLVVPHPGATARDFVLAPLAELVGDQPVLDGRSPASWLAALTADQRTVIQSLPEGLL